jgi:hypothetical protein
MTNNGKLAPTPELISELRNTAHTRNYRTYRRLIEQLDWQQASAEAINRGIGVTIAFTDMKRAKPLTELAWQRFPEDEQVGRYWRFLNPPPARIIKSDWRESPEEIQATGDWLDEHAHEYPLGHWLAVYNGQLVADAPTRNQLGDILDQLREKGLYERGAVTHQVIS